MKVLAICPRCKRRVLDDDSYGESALYRSQHRLCNPCWDAEHDEINREGTNDLPATLTCYGPPNDLVTS